MGLMLDWIPPWALYLAAFVTFTGLSLLMAWLRGREEDSITQRLAALEARLKPPPLDVAATLDGGISGELHATAGLPTLRIEGTSTSGTAEVAGDLKLMPGKIAAAPAPTTKPVAVEIGVREG